MKKRTISATAFIIMALVLFFGCSKDVENEPDIDNSGNGSVVVDNNRNFIYEAMTIPFPPLPDDIEFIENITVAGNRVYFTVHTYETIERSDGAVSYFNSYTIFSMNTDATDLKDAYTYKHKESPPEATGGGVTIDALYIDNDGYIWVVETGAFYKLNLPDDISTDELSDIDIPGSIQELERNHVVRKLDKDGTQLIFLDIGSLLSGSAYIFVTAFVTDDNNNIYITAGSDNSSTIFVINLETNSRFSLNAPTRSIDPVKTSDGSVVCGLWRDGNRILQYIDVQNRNWGYSIDLSFSAHNIFTGDDEFYVIFSDYSGIFGYNKETGVISRILRFIDSGISPNVIRNITLLPNDQILIIEASSEHTLTAENVNLILLTKTEKTTDITNDVEKTVITLGTLWLSPDLRAAVVQFNNTSSTHIINVIDYSDYVPDGDFEGALTRLTTEIVAGRVPDILDLNRLPFRQYANRGMFLDLNPFLDADPEISRDNLMSNVFRAAETDGKLYSVPMGFGISSIIGPPSILGDSPGWTIDEFIAVIEANPQADFPVGARFDRLGFLAIVFFHNMDEYVNHSTGTARFDSDDFVRLLEFANTLPAEADIDLFMHDLATGELKISGRQIMQTFNGDFGVLAIQTMQFGGEIIFKGWPAADRDGNKFVLSQCLAITTGAADKEGAWLFVRSLLTEEFQRNLSWDFSVDKVVFEERLVKATEEYLGGHGAESVFTLSQDLADQLLAVTDSITRITGHGDGEVLWNIISESASDFFNGQTTARDAARVIQSRASIYMAEQRP